METYGVDVLVLELREKGGESLIVSLNSDGLEDSLDAGSGWSGAAERDEEVCCEILHFEYLENSSAKAPPRMRSQLVDATPTTRHLR
jgi:hypothetical protein